MNKKKKYLRLAVAGLGAASMLLLTNDGVQAADHNEAPGTMADPAADIGDYYGWHTEGGTFVAAMTFACLTEGGSPATYDPEVLYGFHIDNDGDDMSDIDIWCRFGTNMAMDEWGVQCLNVPGAAGPVEGAVDTNIDSGDGVMLFGGPREDPFFFDFDGFLATLMSGDLSFDSANDSFAGTNCTTIVLEMDAAAAAGGATTFQTWATTARL